MKRETIRNDPLFISLAQTLTGNTSWRRHNVKERKMKRKKYYKGV